MKPANPALGMQPQAHKILPFTLPRLPKPNLKGASYPS